MRRAQWVGQWAQIPLRILCPAIVSSGRAGPWADTDGENRESVCSLRGKLHVELWVRQVIEARAGNCSTLPNGVGWRLVIAPALSGTMRSASGTSLRPGEIVGWHGADGGCRHDFAAVGSVAFMRAGGVLNHSKLSASSPGETR